MRVVALRMTLRPAAFARRGLARVVVATVAASTVIVSCGSPQSTFACTINLGDIHTRVAIATKVGAAATTSVEEYQVVFKVLAGTPRMVGEVLDANGAALLTVKGQGYDAVGSVATPKGRLDFSCAP